MLCYLTSLIQILNLPHQLGTIHSLYRIIPGRHQLPAVTRGAATCSVRDKVEDPLEFAYQPIPYFLDSIEIKAKFSLLL